MLRWVVVVAAAGCTTPMTVTPDLSATCAADLPAACPSPAPSWSGEVSAIVQDRCAACHAAGSVVPEKPLTTYDDVYARRGTVLNEVYGCLMPPPPEPPLGAGQRQAMLGWLVCGAPNN